MGLRVWKAETVLQPRDAKASRVLAGVSKGLGGKGGGKPPPPKTPGGGGNPPGATTPSPPPSRGKSCPAGSLAASALAWAAAGAGRTRSTRFPPCGAIRDIEKLLVKGNVRRRLRPIQ